MPWGPLRPLEAIQTEHQGQPVVFVRDPEGLLPGGGIGLPLPMFMIATLFDGQRDTREIQQMLAQASGGQIIPTDQLDKIGEEMSRLCLFDDAQSAARRADLEAAWDALPLRPAAHAGTAYPDEPEEFLAIFNEFFAGLAEAANGKRPRGLITPHIDLRLGGRLLAEGIARVHADQPPALYIILGVAHHPTRNLFTLTDKAFDTPVGPVETDPNAVSLLRELYGADRLTGGLAHAAEHSIEFPVVALKYWHTPAEKPVKILPILCGMFPEERGQDEPRNEAISKLILPDSVKPTRSRKSPADRAEVSDFVTALRSLVNEYAGDVVIIASVDLAHVGLKFGEQQGVDEVRALRLREADQSMLQLIAAGDPEAWFEQFRADGNARNVDAVTAVYILLHVLGQLQVEQLGYEQWKEEPTDSMVTYASLALY